MAAQTIDEYIAGLNEPLASVAITLREHIDAALPHATGRMWHGHPVWLDEATPIAGFKAYPSYVTFMLWRGQEIDDDSGTLSPAGSATMATLKVDNPAKLMGPRLTAWLKSAGELG